MPRALRIAAASLVGVLCAGGCRNPFDPSCDIELTQLSATTGTTIYIYEAWLPTSGIYDFSDWTVTARFMIRNKVAATINSITITYTDLDGNPKTAYKSTGGRTFKMSFRLAPVTSNGEFGDGEGRTTSLQIYVVDQRVMEELRSSSIPYNKVMIANILFRGVDENGYDIRLEGRIAIFLYP